MTSRPRTTSFIDAQKAASNNPEGSGLGSSAAGMKISSKDGNKVTVHLITIRQYKKKLIVGVVYVNRYMSAIGAKK